MQKKYVALLILFFLGLIGCTKEAPKPKPQEEVYDWHNEKYQDFYSQYMRKTGKDIVHFYAKDISKYLGVESIPKDATGRIITYKRDIKDYPLSKNQNFLLNKEDAIKAYFNMNKPKNTYEECSSEDRYPDLFCLKNGYPHLMYFYLPNEYRKIANINQGIIFYCNKMDNQYQCEITRGVDGKNNAIIYVDFYTPSNFFYIIPYIENHFYENTGQHLWQYSPN